MSRRVHHTAAWLSLGMGSDRSRKRSNDVESCKVEMYIKRFEKKYHTKRRDWGSVNGRAEKGKISVSHKPDIEPKDSMIRRPR